jgi:hypothetical protein
MFWKTVARDLVMVEGAPLLLLPVEVREHIVCFQAIQLTIVHGLLLNTDPLDIILVVTMDLAGLGHLEAGLPVVCLGT